MAQFTFALYVWLVWHFLIRKTFVQCNVKSKNFILKKIAVELPEFRAKRHGRMLKI